MKSPLIPHGAGKGDKPRPVDKKAYDENFNAIFRPKNRRENQSSTPPKLSGSIPSKPTDYLRTTGATRNRYNRVTGPDGQTVFIRAC